jgi:cytosine/adenosine deaminase-related metal-dependent hydrolase
MSRTKSGKRAVALAMAWSTAAAVHAGSVQSTVTLAGNAAGVQTVERRADGAIAVRFEYADRGRGPELEAVYRLGPNGLPVAVAIDGHEYFQAPVAERFAIAGERARWTNRGERGEVPAEAAARAFYASFDGVPEESALLASALLAAPGGRLALLPAGEGSAEVVATRRVAGADGGEVEARLVEIGGLAFAPFHVWLDPAGGLFAQVSPWFATVRAGYEASAAELQKAQDERSKAHFRSLAAALPRRPAGGFRIRNARLFDSEAKAVRPGWSVVVAGERIAAAGPDAELATPAGAEEIDAGGATLLPGLWDLHTHLGEGDGLLHLASGVLGVRDLANDVEAVGELARQWEAGETLGPRVVLAGFLDGPGPYAGPTKALVSTIEEARRWIDRYAALGYVQVKLYSSLDPRLVAPIAAYAHAQGMRVSGHVPAFMTAEQAVRAGYDEIQHANMLVLNFLFAEVPDTRTPARFSAVAENAAYLNLASPAVKSFLDLLAERGVVLDPTLAIFEGMFTARPGEVSPDLAAVADRLPPLVRRGALGGGLPVPEGKDEVYRASFRKLGRLVRAAWERGIRIVPGTDALAGFALHRELELYAEAGIPNLDVLELATLGSARLAGRERDLGSVRAGKLADFVLVAGRPDETISALRAVKTVVRAGALLDAAALCRALGVKPPGG